MIVVAIIGLLAAIAIPSFVRARQSTQANTCLNNLRLIDGAKDQYALENGQATGAACTAADVSPYLKMGFPVCPIGGTYTIGAIGPDNPSCSAYSATHAATL